MRPKRSLRLGRLPYINSLDSECALLSAASRPHESGRAASARSTTTRPLAARWRGWNEASAGGAKPKGLSKKGLLEKGLLDETYRRDFSTGLFGGTFKRVAIFSKGLRFDSMAMSTTTGGGLRAPLRPLVHVGGGVVDRRAVYHEEQAALREALERGTATIHVDQMLCLWWSPTVSRGRRAHRRARGCPDDLLQRPCPRSARRHAKALQAWQSGAHQLGGAARVAGGALDAVELENESSDGGGGVATALPGRRRSALSASLRQRAAAEGPAGRGRCAKNKVGNCCGRSVIAFKSW